MMKCIYPEIGSYVSFFAEKAIHLCQDFEDRSREVNHAESDETNHRAVFLAPSIKYHHQRNVISPHSPACKTKSKVKTIIIRTWKALAIV